MMEAQTLDLLLRWLHFFAGIVWIGHNYSTLIQRPNYAPLAASDLTNRGSPRFMSLLAREHGIFRWASVVTWASGVGMLWPHQKKVLGFVPATVESRDGKGIAGTIPAGGRQESECAFQRAEDATGADWSGVRGTGPVNPR